MIQEIKLGSFQIGSKQPPFIIAELSANHHHSLERCLELVNVAKKSGVHAVKLQTYTADTLTLNIKSGDFLITDPVNLWKGRTLYDMYQEGSLPWEWHETIFKRCQELGMIGFSSPFDESAVEFLEKLHVPCYKIASPEIVDLPLIKKVASTKKPLFISTGAATEQEIAEAVDVAKSAGCQQLILLKCTCIYPTPPQLSHVRTIPDMRQKFGVPIGISDHSFGIGVSVAAVALGACVVEKHLTLSRTEKGLDDAFSLEPQEFQDLVQETKNAWLSLGQVHYGPLPEEHVTYSHRPSLFFIQDLAAGTKILPKHIDTLRPASGLPPKEKEKIIGSILKTSVKKGTPVQWELLQ